MHCDVDEYEADEDDEVIMMKVMMRMKVTIAEKG